MSISVYRNSERRSHNRVHPPPPPPNFMRMCAPDGSSDYGCWYDNGDCSGGDDGEDVMMIIVVLMMVSS